MTHPWRAEQVCENECERRYYHGANAGTACMAFPKEPEQKDAQCAPPRHPRNLEGKPENAFKSAARIGSTRDK